MIKLTEQTSKLKPGCYKHIIVVSRKHNKFYTAAGDLIVENEDELIAKYKGTTVDRIDEVDYEGNVYPIVLFRSKPC